VKLLQNPLITTNPLDLAAIQADLSNPGAKAAVAVPPRLGNPTKGHTRRAKAFRN
jgi:hypothetical protein